MALIKCTECGERISDRAFMCPHCGVPTGRAGPFGYEYRSEATILGMPLVHVASGLDPATGRKRIARGFIAIGDVAVGVIAFGGVAVGGLAFGGLALGVVALGGLAIGVLLALGGGAVGYIAAGGLAIGYYAFGGAALGAHAFGGNIQDPEAARFLDRFLPGAADFLRSGRRGL